MAELSIEYHWVCMDALLGMVQVQGTNGETYRVEWQCGRHAYFNCSCPAFKYNPRVNCKHLKKALKEACHWNAFFDGGKPTEVEADENHENGLACPKCGGGVTSMAYGV
jgi:hypothetical protein